MKRYKTGRKPLSDKEDSVVVAVRLKESDAKLIPGNKSSWIRECILVRLLTKTGGLKQCFQNVEKEKADEKGAGNDGG